uniref:3'-5' exoribonuclease HELZ2 n=1 Tax=Papio anubis TaxID=9555 RepID=A0A2I3NI64_PAPAN
MVAFDQAVPWEHRSPPPGLSKFELCPKPDLCEYGDACTKAHSAQELQEWIQRRRAVELRGQAAWQDGLVPYQERLLAEYQRSSSEVLVLTETLDGVRVTCNQPLMYQAQERKTQYSWTFAVHSEEPLLHVALLKQEPGANFSLVAPGLPSGRLYARGERFRLPSSAADFQVGVSVQAASFGTFEQWVVFDFGRRPVLLRKLGLQLGQGRHPEPCSSLALGHPEEMERWHTGNRHVVPAVERTAEQTALMAKYKDPALALEFNRSGLASGPISPTNYRQRMHQFLYEEETAQQQLVAKLTLRGPVFLKTALQTPALNMLFAPPGALYAEVPVPPSLMPDTDQGFLLGRAVSTALVAPVPAPNNAVFEVRLEKRASSEQVLWLLLPARCCLALGLQPEARLVLEVQFQIDPMTFRLWHQAVDTLPEEQLVVPDLPTCALPRPWSVPPLRRGNRKQELAVALIAGWGPGDGKRVPPLLIYGPFGTGKTYTLAMASLEVIRRPQAKVLICTHTNSAADIYIREYFHSHVSGGHPEATPLRVMYTDRPPSHTDPVTLQYCCLTDDHQAFRPPTWAELARHRVVVTTTSQARELRVPVGFFSHILIDEAAQMLECEALTPLAYASRSTRLVLAGDHMQVTPRLFSVARARAAEHTLLHRLFLYYQQETHEVARQSRLVFHENYRCTEAIVSFVSRHFYVAKGNPIHARGKVPPHPRHYPLMFCHVAGSPDRDISMTSWLNLAEIAQAVEKVQEAYNTWPSCWGVREQRHICVVSQGAQVSALRQELRRRDLGQVSVGSFEILPGRQFRVVVLSAVHTCQSLLSPGALAPEFFTDARVLNTVLTRAQSQLVVVGDAVALCSFGACGKLWESFIRECVERHSVCPEGLSMEQVEQGVAQRRRWPPRGTRAGAAGNWEAAPEPVGDPAEEPATVVTATVKAEPGDEALSPASGDITATPAQTEAAAAPAGDAVKEDVAPGAWAVGAAAAAGVESTEPEDAEADFWPWDGELNADDAILRELLDESRKVMVTVGEDGLLDTVARPESPRQARLYENLPPAALRRLLRAEPERYRHCTFVQETFERASAIPLDDASSGPIQVRGRLDCGMAFTGDEVLVQLLSGDRAPEGRLRGRVLGVLKRRRQELAFVCRMDRWDPRIMVPINGSVTKIFVAELKDPSRVPVYGLRKGRLQRVGLERLTLEARHSRLFWVHIVLWRPGFYYPLGIVREVLPEASTWEQGLRILGLEYSLRVPPSDLAAITKALQKYQSELGRVAGRREDCRAFLTFTVDPQGACNLDDALSVRDLGPRCEVAVHITDVASFVPRDGVLDVEARRQGAAFYAPGREPVPMLPASLCQDILSLLPGRDRLAISLFLTMEKASGQLKSLHFAPSVVRSDRQLSYEEAEQFNRLVAEFLVGSERTRTVTPLRWQPAPHSQQLKALCEKHGERVPLSLHLSHHLRGGGGSAPDTQLHLLASLWKQVQFAARTQDYEQMVDLVTTDDMHPFLAPAGRDLRKALERSAFGRCTWGHRQQGGHYSLQVEWYTWATSPIRRYLDVVLQRQILLALGHGGSAYSARDIDGLCQGFSLQHALAQSYQRRAQSLHLAVQLKAQPLDKLGFVVDVEAGSRCFRLQFPSNRETLPDPCPVPYSSLQLAEHPRALAGRPGMQLLWRRRVYSVQGSGPPLPLPGTVLDPHTWAVEMALWKQLLALVELQRWPEAAALIQEKGEASPRRGLVQVQRSRCGHFLEVAQELGSGDTLQVQLGASLQHGFLVPSPQLWTVAPGFSLCLEHVERPGDCFLGHVYQAPRDRYRDVDEYTCVWEPFCALESATGAVAENDAVTLQHLSVSWDVSRMPQGQLQGAFRLEAAFLEENCVDINLSCCYLCIRLEGLPAPTASPRPGPSSLGPGLSVDPGTYTWVAHGQTEDCDQESRADRQEAPRQVHLFIHHMGMEKVPEEVLRPGTLFTVELLPKQLPDLRKEEAVRGLEEASPLVTSIALGRPVPQPLCRGTGKTIVGLHIIFWFHKSNQEQVQPGGSPHGETQLGGPCILYCGPSNKSVDVLAELLLRRTELKPLRVYGEQAEASEFPVPRLGSRKLLRRNPREGRPNQSLRSITLHHRIRQAPNPYSSEIKAFDTRLQSGELFSREDLVLYKKVLWEARKFELDRHEVILCTCSCAASASLKTLDVRQILVDEAGMATEPETLIPLVRFPQAEKVVLLGDHKQLRPVVKNEWLQNLGLDRSLFERYHEDAHMLDTQYRMHEGICAFPSMAFYKSRLKMWQGLKRPPSVLGHAGKESCPVIFGHVQGHERSLLVSTDEGNENSKANLEEVAEVVRITKQLTLGRTIEPQDVAVLTPYNAQASEISKALRREGITGVAVSSITKSQGSEWRYVLVSTVRTCAKSDLDQRPTKSWLKKFLGFVVDPNQVNVAVTRAQEGLCLIGDHLLLRCCPLWRSLLDFCEAQQSLVPAGQVRICRRPTMPS